MDAETIKFWIKNLGRGYAELVANGIVPDQPLVKPFEESNWPAMHPAPGLELVFWDETKCMEQVMIILVTTVGQSVYTGELPAPFTLSMDRKAVRSVLGQPRESKGPGNLPGGLGMRGGWDSYPLPDDIHPNAKVTFSYLENFVVNNVSFSLIDKGHD